MKVIIYNILVGLVALVYAGYVLVRIHRNAIVFSKNLRYLRRKCGIQQAELAKMSGISRVHLSDIECGRKKNINDALSTH